MRDCAAAIGCWSRRWSDSSNWGGSVYWWFSLIETRIRVSLIEEDDANSLAHFPPRWSRKSDGCWWSRPETRPTAKDRSWRAATGCRPSLVPSVYSSWSSRTHRDPQSPNGSGQRWWCRCWGQGSWEETSQALSCAGRDRTGSRQVRAPVWWRVPSGLMCRQTWMPLRGREPGPGSPTPTG